MDMKQAQAMRAAMVEGGKSLDDQTASTAPKLFPMLTGSGKEVPAGTRIQWNGQVKRAAVTVWDRTDQDPDHAALLWEDLDYVDGVRRIPSAITAGTAFAKGEKGWWKGAVYESSLEANVWTPEEYPDGWIKQ